MKRLKTYNSTTRCLTFLFVFSHLFVRSQSISQLLPLKSYLGEWIIYKDSSKRDTLCVTRSSWSPDGKRLVAGQQIWENNEIAKDSCFYYYNDQKKSLGYYETDETGKQITSTSDLLIDGNTWRDDNGKSWQTTRSGKEYKIQTANNSL